MEPIVLLSKDEYLGKELAGALPQGFKLETNALSDDAIIFFDVDSMKAALIRELSEKTSVIAVTGQKRTDPVMEAAASGAYETLQRPLNGADISRILQELHELNREIKHPIAISSPSPVPTCAIVGHSQVIMDTCKKLARLAQVEVPVLITGETGTGKELFAESIAQLSSRFGKPFVVVNCAAIPETLLESELFGFEKGSFTGALAAKEGILKIADGGCVFFDEVGELPLSLQGKLLRFLQTRTFYPLGSTKEVEVDVRVISATNRDMASMVREGKFREDLYHRLRVAAIHVPPLRERKEDMLSLVQFFINRYRHTASRQIKGITRAFFKKLVSYDWPGNIRELENSIRSAIALSKTHYLTTFELRELGEYPLSGGRPGFSETLASSIILFLKNAVRKKEKNIYEKIHAEVDRSVFEYILSSTKENQSEAARILGINRLTLRKKLKY
ncbi:MAG: sigma-54-dependent Fis family transcriptional regulator [Nitrospiraceae bacterium]|nr:MAG: sigma-54-dependent Fis family transcriptional regulator [Nitrospiraceae bacterium]